MHFCPYDTPSRQNSADTAVQVFWNMYANFKARLLQILRTIEHIGGMPFCCPFYDLYGDIPHMSSGDLEKMVERTEVGRFNA